MRYLDKATRWSLGVWLVLVAPLLPWRCWYEDTAMPPWIQAIGSVAAIVGAAWVAGWQFKRTALEAKQNHLREHRRMLDNWCHLFGGVSQKCADIGAIVDGDVLIGPFYLDGLEDELRTILGALERLDLNLLNGYDEVEPAISGISRTRAVLHLISRVRAFRVPLLLDRTLLLEADVLYKGLIECGERLWRCSEDLRLEAECH